MPFNPVTKTFSRIWKFVDQFGPGDNADRVDFDVALDDLSGGIQGSFNDLDVRVTKATDDLAASLARREFLDDAVELQDGVQSIAPLENICYYIDGLGAACDLSIAAGTADRFFLAVFSQDTGTGINVLETNAVAGPCKIGFSDGGSRVVEFRRRGASGQYYIVGSTRLGGSSTGTGSSVSAISPLPQGMFGIAHRGFSGTAPENTLPSYSLAASKGFKHLEADLRLTSDGVWVLLHDDAIDRTSDGTGDIDGMTLTEARTYDFGSWKSANYTGTVIPTAEEFFNLCFRQQATPIVEIKIRATQAQINNLVDIAFNAGVADRIVYTSFESEDLQLVQAKDPTANLGHISTNFNADLIAEAVGLKNGQNTVAMVVNNANITASVAADAIAAGLYITAWTVNNSSLLEGLSEKGVVGVATDVLEVESLLASIDGVSGSGGGGSFDYGKLVPGVFFNDPHYEYDGQTLYVKPTAFASTSNVAYIRGGSLPDNQWTYDEIKADLANFSAPAFAATGITSPSGVADCIRLGNETSIWYDPITDMWGWGGRDNVSFTDRVKVLENNYGQLGDCSEKAQAVLRLASSGTMSNAAVKAAYEANANTNAFTDPYKTKLDGIEAGATAGSGGSASFDYSQLVPGVFFNAPHYEYSGTTLYVKPTPFAATSNVAYIRGGSLPDNEWTYAQLKADLAEITAPAFAATGITSPSGVTDCIRLGNETTIWYDPVTDKWAWGGRDNTLFTNKVKVLENNYGQIGDCSEKAQAVLVLASASGGGATMTNAQVKTAYEANANTNAFTDTEKTKLAGIETGATAGGGTSGGYDPLSGILDLTSGSGSGVRSAGYGTDLVLRAGSTDRLRLQNNGIFRPIADGAYRLGNFNARWSTIYSTDALSTSDARKKTAPKQITDTVLDAWGDVDFVSFEWLDGANDYTNFGVIAQQVIAAFAAHGLNVMEYGLVDYDEWEDQYDEEGNLEISAGNIYSIRSDQMQFLQAAWVRREFKRVQDRG